MGAGYTALRTLFTNISTAIKSKKPTKAITNLDINALLLRKTGKQIAPNELDSWMTYISNYGWYRGEDAYNYFFLIPDGLTDTYNRDLGAGIFFIATTNGTGIQEGTFTAEYMKDVFDRDFVRFTNHTGSTVSMTGLDTFYYSSGSKKYFTKSWGQITVYNNNTRDVYITMAIDKGYQPSDCLFFNNDISDVPIDAQDFPEEILNLDVGYPRPDYFEETKAQILADFPDITSCYSDGAWDTIKNKYLSIPNSSLVAVQMRDRTFWDMHYLVGVYDSKYTLVDSFDGSYGSRSYNWALFPNTGKQNYACCLYDSYDYTSNFRVYGSENTFLGTYFSSYDYIKKVDYHRVIPDTSKSLNNLFTAIADAIRVKKGNQSLITAANFPTEIGTLYKDILSAKDMNSWTIDGTVTVTYSNKINDIEYSNSSGTVFTSFNDLYTYLNNTYSNIYAGFNVSDLEANANYNSATNPYKVYILDQQGSSSCFLNIFVLSATDTMELNGNILSSNRSSVKDLCVGYNGREYINQNSVNLPFDFGSSYANSLIELTVDTSYVADKSISTTLTVVSGKNYSFQFEGCSPTGFTADTNQVSIVSGSNTVTQTFNNTQTSTYSSYTMNFTADGTSATITFDLSKMVNGSNVELLIKDMKVYKLT